MGNLDKLSSQIFKSQQIAGNIQNRSDSRRRDSRSARLWSIMPITPPSVIPVRWWILCMPKVQIPAPIIIKRIFFHVSPSVSLSLMVINQFVSQKRLLVFSLLELYNKGYSNYNVKRSGAKKFFIASVFIPEYSVQRRRHGELIFQSAK